MTLRWKKLGRIFDFAASPVADDHVSHAQSPQAVVFPEFVRIYFSTRTLSPNGKPVSHVRFVDFDRSLRSALRHGPGDVVALGAPGTFDEHGIFPFSPVLVGERIFGYTTGWTRRQSVDADSGIGLAISDDGGELFNKIGAGPVLSSSLHEPFLVCDGFVRVVDGVFHMFYVYGTAWRRYGGSPRAERTYVIGHAVSGDGIAWEKDGRQIIPSAFEGECQALPTVLRIGARHHMYFCHRSSVGFRDDPEHAYRLGYAYSDDLVTWARNDDAAGIGLSETGWDSEMMCYPHLFRCGDAVHLLYNGNGFGRGGFGAATLIDGGT
jgi:hypothetical protein